MKRKISSIWRVGLALVLVLSLGVVMAVPVAASHTSSATVAFHAGASQLVGEASALDVEVTSDGGSLGKINQVKIDFSGTDFTGIGKGVEPANWTGVVDGLVITYTAAPGVEIAAGASLTFYPTVINPATPGTATNPTVKTTDPGTKAALTTGTGVYEISYVADAVGVAGNSITVAYTEATADSALIVTVTGTDISVEMADTTSTIDSTADEVVAAINADDDAKLLVDASTTQTGLMVAAVAAPLIDGSDPDVDEDCPVTGLLTIKEFVVTAVPVADSSGTATDYTVSFTTLTEIAATTGTIIITFPSGYAISLLVEGDITMTVAGSGYTPSAKTINATARTVTITANEVIAVDKAVVVTIVNSHVKNPPTSGTYDIAVLTSGPDEGSGEVTIIPASFNVVAGVADTVTAGTAFAVTVSALNADAGSDTGYTGSHFIDFAQVGGTAGTIPDFELISFTAGVGTSPANFILTVAGETGVTITAEENGLTGTSAAITINPAVVLASLTISGTLPSPVAGVAFVSPTNDITVTAKDAEGNVKTDYVGTVTWTATDDELAVLPADYTFTSGDLGVKVFLGSEFTLKTSGTTQTITVTDGLVSDTSSNINVAPAAATAIEIAASPGVILADGSDTSTITATALDAFGNTDTNYVATVVFAESLGVITAEDAAFGDTSPGLAIATLTSIAGEVGTAIIKVTSGTLPYATTTVKLLAVIGINSIEVTVDKTSILNNGVDERTITATYNVATAEGADYTVTFTHNGDPTKVTLDPADGVVVPVAGVATVTLTTTADAATTIVVTGTGIGGINDDLDAPINVALGTHDISLSQGWNLISLPLIPVDDSIETVLAELITAGTVIQVRAYSDGTWGIWASTGTYADNPTLSKMEDGRGFWVQMSAGDILTATGYILPAPPETPHSYSIDTGWNLIGFTKPDALPVGFYLGLAVMPTFEMMYGYDAATGIYDVVVPSTPPGTGIELVPGQGYWLAVSADGTIYP